MNPWELTLLRAAVRFSGEVRIEGLGCIVC